MYGFAEARLRCHKYMPYVYHHVASLIPVERPGLGSLAVDPQMRIYYDPDVFDQWPIDQSTAAILHEDMHVLLHHHKRADDYLGGAASPADWERWNVACDLVVNQTLKDVPGLSVPEDWLTHDTYGFERNLSVEDYYELLEKQDEQPPQTGHDDQPDDQQSDDESDQNQQDDQQPDQNQQDDQPGDQPDGGQDQQGGR